MERATDAMDWALAALRDPKARVRYKRYADYADGTQDLAYATAKFEAVFGRRFEALAYNRCAGVVDAIADRLHVEGFRLDDEERPEAAADAAAIWAANRMDARHGELVAEALRAGDSYLVVWPEAAGARLPDGRPLPTFWPQAADQVRVRYDEERPGRIVQAAKAWKQADGRRRLTLFFPDRIEKYVTATKAPSGLPASPSAFRPCEVPGEPWPVPNPWGTVPVFHYANNAPTGALGRSELRDVIPLQDAINNVVANLVAAVELVAFPLKAIIGLDAGDPETKEALGRIEAGMDKILTIPLGPESEGPQPRIDEFSAGNLQQVIAVVELFDKAVSRVSRVPVHYLQMSGDFPSGRALRTADAPFVAKIEDRQAAFGNVDEDAMRLALRMVGHDDPGGMATVWKSAAPMAEEDEWDIALQMAGVGVPLGEILRRLGWDDAEVERVAQERAAAGKDQAFAFLRDFNGGQGA